MEVETVLGKVTVKSFLAGHGVVTTKTEWENGRLVRYWQKPVDDIHGIEIRLEPDAHNRAGRVLWHGTARTPLGGQPQLPEEATIFLNALRTAKPRRRYRRRAGAGRGEPSVTK